MTSAAIAPCPAARLAAFAVAAAGCLAAALPIARAEKSAAGWEARAAAMAKTVTIRRDAYGVPHVYGPTDAACVFGFLYAQAEDYFWQIEDSYLRGLGRAAEIYGQKELANDLVNRALEISRLAKEEWEASPPKSREIGQALADGLNFYLATHPQTKPRLISRFEPWHALAFRRYALYQSFIYRFSGAQPSEILNAVQEIKDGKTAAAAVGPELLAKLRAAEEDQDSMAAHVGSNMWAVRPEKSTTGRALMFINPHQPFFGPGQWYEGHLVSGEGWNLLGACFFGSPFPTIGYNGHVAWSHTVNQPDIADLFTVAYDDPANPKKYRFGDGQRDLVEWTDLVAVKGPEGATSTRAYRFRKTHQGPIVAVRDGKPLAVRFAKLAEGGAIEEWLAMGKAKNVAEFKDAMRPCAIPMFNAMAADNQGNIFYVYNGAVPKRSTKFDWAKPVDGSNPETDWRGYHSFDELPQALNPKCGWLQNCNQQPVATFASGKELKEGEADENPKSSQFPPYFMREPRDNGRARISRRILASAGKFDLESWAKAGFDTHVLEAEARIPEMVQEWEAAQAKDPQRAAKLKEAVELLKAWKPVSEVDSVEMTLFTLTFDRAMQMAERARREGKMAELLNSPRLKALEATLADLEKNHGTWKVTWGELNRIQRIHGSQIDSDGRGAFRDDRPSLPVAGAPGPVGIVFNFYARPAEGQKRRYGVAGSSYVAVVDLAPQPKAYTILQFGQSGDPASPHWFDQAQLYAQGKFKPSWHDAESVKAHAERSYHPGD